MKYTAYIKTPGRFVKIQTEKFNNIFDFSNYNYPRYVCHIIERDGCLEIYCRETVARVDFVKEEWGYKAEFECLLNLAFQNFLNMDLEEIEYTLEDKPNYIEMVNQIEDYLKEIMKLENNEGFHFEYDENKGRSLHYFDYLGGYIYGELSAEREKELDEKFNI